MPSEVIGVRPWCLPSFRQVGAALNERFQWPVELGTPDLEVGRMLGHWWPRLQDVKDWVMWIYLIWNNMSWCRFACNWIKKNCWWAWPLEFQVFFDLGSFARMDPSHRNMAWLRPWFNHWEVVDAIWLIQARRARAMKSKRGSESLVLRSFLRAILAERYVQESMETNMLAQKRFCTFVYFAAFFLWRVSRVWI